MNNDNFNHRDEANKGLLHSFDKVSTKSTPAIDPFLSQSSCYELLQFNSHKIDITWDMTAEIEILVTHGYHC